MRMGDSMRKTISCLLLIIMIAHLLAVNCFANESEMNIIYFEDGSYIVDTIEITGARASGSISGSRTRSYYDDNGNLDWKAVLNGSFSYTGSSATCTSSSVNVTVYDSSWYTISKSATKSGNTASASVTMGCKLLGITTNRITVTPTLSCDANGNLS